ncbi:MAG: geranylgeranylglyceryl phosphate synthase family protein [Flavobacteriales bacterium]|nr:geranylgeranylglyceryl phosphate synthase family protein [Flavobacteriales bacterium]
MRKSELYHQIQNAYANREKHLVFLLDPDKVDLQHMQAWLQKIEEHQPFMLLVGGSQENTQSPHALVSFLKKNTTTPVVIFPADAQQISTEADAILFLQLLSGRNPSYLIEKQLQSVTTLAATNVEIIPTTYLLIESSQPTTVQQVTNTTPLSRTDLENAYQHAQVGIWFGHQLVYLEAGSGASQAVPLAMVKEVSSRISVPILVGGGIKNKLEVEQYYEAGATFVVIGTALELQKF